MIYCINSNCTIRQNPDDLEYCQTCGTKLLINERYQIVRPLRAGKAYNSEVFEVEDLNERGTFKVLKCLASRHKNSKFAELFEKEAQVLIWLSSAWQKHPGIPCVRPDGYFTFGLSNGFRKLQCLVMEKIEGQNLEEWIEENQPISQEQALNWLQQLVEIMDGVHRQGLWHRDIKPSNIMLKPDGKLVLIDFGAVGVGETIIVSTSYTPQEQIEGRTVPQSDFFALGRTFVYLLTGRHPSELPSSTTELLIWRNLAPTVSRNLAQLIDDLMATVPANRPQNTQEIWQRIQAIDSSDEPEKAVHNVTPLVNSRTSEITQGPDISTNQSRRFLFKVLWGGSATLLLGLAGITIYNVLPCQVLGNFKPCSAAIDDQLSFGEEILSYKTPKKQKGVDAFRDRQYRKAVDWLEKARKIQRNDPETLIYLNNAKLEAQKAKSYTIAVAAPLKSSELNSGLEILRGVAQAQDEFNNKQNGVGIKVLIADDANDPQHAKQIAKDLVNQDVLAVVGHFTSDSTKESAEVYQQNQLVFVSPTSTSEDLSDQEKSYHPNFFFRTVSSDRDTAEKLASYLIQQPNQQTAAVFYNTNSSYSNSIQNQFCKLFSAKGGKVVYQDLSMMSNPENAINEVGKQGVKVLALFPNSQSSILHQTKKLINANRCQYHMVGGDTVYTSDILDEVGKEPTKCLVVAVPWNRRDSPDSKFPQAAENLWAGQVSWRTALAYDATRVLVAALEKELEEKKVPTRTLLQQTLSDPSFQAMGATGRIRFQPNGNRKDPQIQLVTVQSNK